MQREGKKMMVSYTYSAEEKGMIEILKGAMPFRSEHEIYKALKECSKEALQNLLFQDTFEEVKEKPEKQIEKREMETTKSVMDRGLSYEGCKFYQEDRYDSSGSSEYHTVLSKDENAISISSEENPSSPYESTGSTFTQSSSDSDSPIINDSEQTNVEGNTANSSSLSETTYQPLDLIADIVKVLSEIEEEGSLHIDSLNLPKTSEQIIGEDITSTSSSQPLTTSNPSDLIADIEKILVTNMEEEGSLYNDPLKLIETSKSYDAASYVPSVSHFGEPPLGQTREDDEKFILPSHLKAPTVGCPPLNFGTYNSKSPSTTIGIRAPTSLKMDSGNLSTPNNYLSTQPLIETSENCDAASYVPPVSHFAEPLPNQTLEDDGKFILPSHLQALAATCPPLNFGTYNSRSPYITTGIHAPASLEMDSGNLSIPSNYSLTKQLIETSENYDGASYVPPTSSFGEPLTEQNLEDDGSHLQAPDATCPPIKLVTYNSESQSITMGIHAPTSFKKDSGNLSTPENNLSIQQLLIEQFMRGMHAPSPSIRQQVKGPPSMGIIPWTKLDSDPTGPLLENSSPSCRFSKQLPGQTYSNQADMLKQHADLKIHQPSIHDKGGLQHFKVEDQRRYFAIPNNNSLGSGSSSGLKVVQGDFLSNLIIPHPKVADYKYMLQNQNLEGAKNIQFHGLSDGRSTGWDYGAGSGSILDARENVDSIVGFEQEQSRRHQRNLQYPWDYGKSSSHHPSFEATPHGNSRDYGSHGNSSSYHPSFEATPHGNSKDYGSYGYSSSYHT